MSIRGARGTSIRRATVLTLFAVLAAISGPLASARPVATAPWQVSRIDGQCWLVRQVGGGDNRVLVGVVPSLTTTNGASLALLSSAEAAGHAQGTGRVRIDGAAGIPIRFHSYNFYEAGRLIWVTGDLDAAALRTAGAVAIQAENARWRFDWRGIADAWPMLSDCLARQRAALGIDPALLLPETVGDDFAADPRHPLTDPATWITGDDYPASERDIGHTGDVTAVWRIGQDGRVHDCRIVQTSGAADLDVATCAAITRSGRYQPAHGAQGRPVDGFDQRRAAWRIAGY